MKPHLINDEAQLRLVSILVRKMAVVDHQG
jgi:hypothetical protein